MQAHTPLRPAFDTLTVEIPDQTSLTARFERDRQALEQAATVDQALAAIDTWDRYARRLSTWKNLAEIHFQQETNNASYRERKSAWDALTPTLLGLNNTIKQTLLQHPLRAAVEQQLGAQAFQIWDCDERAFSDSVAEATRVESELVTEYTALIGSARCEIDGEHHNLASAGKFLSHVDRSVRRKADAARCAWYSANQAELDRLYHELVQCRHGMATALGFEDFVEMGYLRLHRVDYGPDDVAQVREWVVTEILPLCARVYDRQRRALGIDRLCFYDELVLDGAPPPKPQGDPQWILGQSHGVFDAIHPELGRFFSEMVDGNYCDLIARDHKAPGGFCAELPSEGTTFVYSNFNGTKADIDVLVHEMGHAFQFARSGQLPLLDYLWPTMEGAEITSMGLELLAYSQASAYFGPDAERYCRQHLTQSLTFLPYGVAVDHFQHLVYRSPQATPEERNGFWQAMERRYLPHRDYDGLDYPESGRIWQRKHHIYSFPFYYVDYVLAFICAFQLYVIAQEDSDAALQTYLRIADLGGSLPFLDLLREAGLGSPFDPAVLSTVSQQLAVALDL